MVVARLDLQYAKRGQRTLQKIEDSSLFYCKRKFVSAKVGQWLVFKCSGNLGPKIKIR